MAQEYTTHVDDFTRFLWANATMYTDEWIRTKTAKPNWSLSRLLMQITAQIYLKSPKVLLQPFLQTANP